MASIPLMPTNWSTSILIPRFDPALGTLNSVLFQLAGHVEGVARFESLDMGPATVTVNLSASIKLQRPDLTPLVTTIPLVSVTETVGRFDGTIDFGGTSGRTYSDLMGDDLDSSLLSAPFSPTDAANFIGSGAVTLPAMATGASSGSGAGNAIYSFQTRASATATIIYDYTPIPEPASAGVLALGVLLAGSRRRRRSA